MSRTYRRDPEDRRRRCPERDCEYCADGRQHAGRRREAATVDVADEQWAQAVARTVLYRGATRWQRKLGRQS